MQIAPIGHHVMMIEAYSMLSCTVCVSNCSEGLVGIVRALIVTFSFRLH